MTAQSRTVLKSYFQRGLRPTQSNYGDLIDSFALVSADAQYLPITGGIMTGAIQLPGVPTSALAAATKGYVDAIVSAGGVVVGGSNGQIQYNNAGALGGFTVSGDAASLATTGVLTLASTAVSAGTYVNPTVTVDAKGRITNASSGSATAVATVKKQIFTASGTYTPSAGMLYCIVEVLGAGGGGGRYGVSSSDVGAGGAAGGYGKSWLSAATVGASKTVTIGAGGAGANTNGGTGTTGGTSSFGALISCTGGAGGIGTGGVKVGATGGTSSSADLNITGFGSSPTYVTTVAGPGADSPYGVGGASRVTAGAGNNASGYGAGGGGGHGTNDGGNGTDGIVIITEFCSQ